jgi:hypothetical protein
MHREACGRALHLFRDHALALAQDLALLVCYEPSE